jgi:U3 small nucleolar RNA-associated protein MPP10
MYEDDDDEDDEFGEQMTFDDFCAEVDGAKFSNDEDEDEADFSFDEDDSEGDEHKSEGEEDSEGDGRDTIERLKDDLFADEEEPQNGLSLRHCWPLVPH